MLKKIDDSPRRAASATKKPSIPVSSKMNPSIGGNIKVPAIIASISAVVARGYPGVFRATQLDTFGKIGPKKNPQRASPKYKLSLLSIAKVKGKSVAKIETKIIV